MKILVLNAGSSSQKSCLYDLDILPSHPPQPIWAAGIDWTVNPDYAVLTVKAQGIKQEINLSSQDRPAGIARMLDTLVTGETKVVANLADISIVGHRVVHGGTEYSQATMITPQVKETIKKLIPLAPSHNPAHLEGIEAIEQVFGDVPQVAVFDTAFHRSIPPESSLYPIPYQWSELGIRRYGFHGTSHQYCSQRAAELLGKPLESLKMMGFTPLEGLMMGTRSGSIDPGILIYLEREYQYNPDSLNSLLNKESGLKGISGISGDMRAITTAMAEGNERAKLAFEMYIHRLKGLIGSMIASLEGLDVLVFTAGIGENSALVREKASQGWPFLGLELDLAKNAARPRDEDIASETSKVRVMVIATAEDWAIARECWHLSP